MSKRLLNPGIVHIFGYCESITKYLTTNGNFRCSKDQKKLVVFIDIIDFSKIFEREKYKALFFFLVVTVLEGYLINSIRGP